jgi:hypothetical protein
MDPTPEMQQLGWQLRAAVEELCTVLFGSAHGILRGSHEAALVEAQGGEIVRNVDEQITSDRKGPALSARSFGG